MYITRAAADAYITAEIARSVNRGKAIQLTRASPEFQLRDASARMDAGITTRAAEGSKRHQAIAAAWQPKGAQHAQKRESSATSPPGQHLEPAA